MITINAQLFKTWGDDNEGFNRAFIPCKKPLISDMEKVINFTYNQSKIQLEHSIYQHTNGVVYLYEEASNERTEENNGWYKTPLTIRGILSLLMTLATKQPQDVRYRAIEEVAKAIIKYK